MSALKTSFFFFFLYRGLRVGRGKVVSIVILIIIVRIISPNNGGEREKSNQQKSQVLIHFELKNFCSFSLFLWLDLDAFVADLLEAEIADGLADGGVDLGLKADHTLLAVDPGARGVRDAGVIDIQRALALARHRAPPRGLVVPARRPRDAGRALGLVQGLVVRDQRRDRPQLKPDRLLVDQSGRRVWHAQPLAGVCAVPRTAPRDTFVGLNMGGKTDRVFGARRVLARIILLAPV